jgi:hypothetical protein
VTTVTIITVFYSIIKIDDFLTSRLINEYLIKLNNPTVINTSIKFTYQSYYSDLESLRKDYPGFTPKITHWSEYGSALLHYTNLGWGLGGFAVSLPEKLVVIDSAGTYITSRLCGSGEGKCEVVPPKLPELGVVVTLNYRVEAEPAKEQPATKFNITWPETDDKSGIILANENCFSAYMPKALNKDIYVTTFENTALLQFPARYGYFRINSKFNLDSVKRGKGLVLTSEIHQITRSEFMKEKDCNTKGR